MGTVKGSARLDADTSHGICESCLNNFEFQKGVPLQRYLDSIPLPVIVVDRHVVVKAANRTACETLCKDPVEMVQHLAGNVFECAHARLPEGCGNTVHCSGCAIRRSVTKTFETGEPQICVAAVLRRGGPGHPQDITLTITTVRSGNAVMLRMDSVDGAVHG
jgi:PAS domain-containing protein